MQDLPKVVKKLGIPDVVIVAGIRCLDHRLSVVGLDLIGTVFRKNELGFLLDGFGILPDFGYGNLHAVSVAQVPHLHADIGPRACSGEYHRFPTVHAEKGFIIPIVQIPGLAEEELAHAIVSGQRKLDLIRLAGFQLDARVTKELGVPRIVDVSQIGDGDRVAVDRKTAVFSYDIVCVCAVILCVCAVILNLLRRGRSCLLHLADGGGDGVALAQVPELHADIERIAGSREGDGPGTCDVHKGGVIAVVQVRGLAHEELAHAVVAGKIKAQGISHARLQGDARSIEDLGIPHVVVIAGVRGGNDAVLNGNAAVFRTKQLRALGLGQFHQVRYRDRDGVAFAKIPDLQAEIYFAGGRGEGNGSIARLRGKGLVIAVVHVFALAEEELAHAVFPGQSEAHLVLFALRQLQTGVKQELGAPNVVVVIRVGDSQLAAVKGHRAVIHQLDASL